MKKGLMPIVLLFVLVSAAAIIFSNWMASNGIDETVVLFANALLFVLTLAGYFMYSKSSTTTGNLMLLNIYGSFMLKFFTVAIAVLIYVVTAKQLNRPALYVGMVLYLLYSFIAVRNMFSLRKKSGDAERKSTV